MVAKITSPQGIKRVLNYNEKKVQKGQAVCNFAGNFLIELGKMNFHHKLQRFENLISLNERAKKTNTLHISLNFHPSEKLDTETLSRISESYMDKIGFGSQPFLVYEHKDAGHPHIHIVTTSIEASGKRIDTFNIGRLKSEQARKEIELEFGLIKALGRNQVQIHKIEAARIEYGKSETKRSITNILDRVINQYNFNSLASFNAVLKTFNVVADRGKEGGRIHKFNGLIYHILDQNGNKIGVPVKASSIYSKPTLENLDKKFKKNHANRISGRQRLKITLDLEMAKNPKNISQLTARLKKEEIDTVLRKNDQGFLFGITFVDHRNKSVFNGSEIGKEYSVVALQNAMNEMSNLQKSILLPRKQQVKLVIPGKILSKHDYSPQILKDLLKPDTPENNYAYELMKKKRKKKRKLGL
jgi:hypothetical protein